MGIALFASIAMACFVLGTTCRRAWIFAAAGLWVVGLGVAALAGAFRATAEDNSLGVFVFTGIPTALWLLAFCLGCTVRVAARRASTRDH
jgi:hypothetical protein